MLKVTVVVITVFRGCSILRWGWLWEHDFPKLENFNSRRHSPSGFSRNVIVVETSYQMLEVFTIILQSGEGLVHQQKFIMLAFLKKISTMKLFKVFRFWWYATKKLKVKSCAHSPPFLWIFRSLLIGPVQGILSATRTQNFCYFW